jgi:uncharacterized protein (TIGR03083 family)
MERAVSWGLAGAARHPDRSQPAGAGAGAAPDQVLEAYHDGVTAVSQLAARFSPEAWDRPTPCPEWRARDLAGHLCCMADDYHEYLDDAPASRYARLIGSGPHPRSLARKLARQNAAELAALADAPASEYIAAFAWSARAYARRLAAVWNLPHHEYRGQLVTVAGMAGAAGAEWHLHAWDLARALGTDHRPADPGAVLAGWQAGMVHLPVSLARGCALAGPAGRRADPWHAVLLASGRLPV